MRNSSSPELLDENASTVGPSSFEVTTGQTTECWEGGDTMSVTMDWSVTTGVSTVKTAPLPTPHGKGDLSQMQDALQAALCNIHGPTKSGTAEITEEIDCSTLKLPAPQLQHRSPEPSLAAAEVTGVSVLTDWPSDNDDD
jgi:hypothetical protein